MKSLLLKLLIIGLVGLVESAVGLPVLALTLFLVWKREDSVEFVGWLVGVSLLMSILWGIGWGMTAVTLLIVRISYDFLSQHLLNKLLRLAVIVIPTNVFFAVIMGVTVSWNIMLYSVVSFLILVIFQRFLIASYEKRYL